LGRLRSLLRVAGRTQRRVRVRLSSPATTTVLIVVVLAAITGGLVFVAIHRPIARNRATTQTSTAPVETQSPSPATSTSESPSTVPSSTPSAPTCSSEPGTPCPPGAIRTPYSGPPHISITTDISDPEPTVGEILTIRTEVENVADPYCCVFQMSVARDPLPILNDCSSDQPPSGLTKTGGRAVKTITWKVEAAGNWVVNVHAEGNCGSSGGSEQNGWISFATKGWGAHPPSPTPSPSPDPTPSVAPSETPTPSPST